MLDTYEKRSRLKLVTTIVAVLVVAGIVLIADHFKSKAAAGAVTSSVRPAKTTVASDDTVATQSSSSSSSSSGYKDGTYSAASSYFVPHSEEQIQVSLTVKNGVITDSSVQNSEGDPTSAAFQQDFASQYKSYVVGQKLSSLQLSVVAGASDTTQGFDDAVSQIASQAQA